MEAWVRPDLGDPGGDFIKQNVKVSDKLNKNSQVILFAIFQDPQEQILSHNRLLNNSLQSREFIEEKK